MPEMIAIRSFEATEGKFRRGDKFTVATADRFNKLVSLGLAQDANTPLEDPLPMITPPPPNDLFSTANPGVVSLMGHDLMSLNFDDSTAVAAGGSRVMRIKAPAGKLAEIIHFGVSIPAPAGATTGTHRVTIGLGSAGSYDRLLDATFAQNYAITIVNGMITGLFNSATPSEPSLQMANHSGLVLGETDPLSLWITYINNTDVPQNANKILRAFARVYDR